ncbi:Cell cycle checkpoint protein rad17 [Aspergillus hancockii]|nr:Cell cycle checkpoint protein rad17 [Aspergillus hancockii]
MVDRRSKRQRRLAIKSSVLDIDFKTQNEKTENLHAPVEGDRTDLASLATHSPQLDLRSISSNTDRAHPAPLSTDKGTHTKSASPLYNFFEPASLEQRLCSQKFEATCLPKATSRANGDDGDDIIDDDYDSYDELFTQHFASDQFMARDVPKTQSSWREQSPRGSVGGARKHTNTHKRFILPLVSDHKNKNSYSLDHQDYKLPWAQQYPPENLNELAVHKKKVLDVQSWLCDAFAGNTKHRLLVLRGPAGSGKTTTIKLLAQTLGFDILEWKNPPVSDFATTEYVSVATQFEEFLGRGNKFRRLDLDEVIASPHGGQDSNRYTQQCVILVEEYPTLLNRSSSSLAAFRLTLQRYLAMDATLPSNVLHRSGSDAQASSPIVVIVSEALLNSGCSSESLTVHRLLGPDLYNHPSTTIIDFNSIAPTFMYKALRLILGKEARHSRRDKDPGPAVLQSISKSGDIRSAVASLEFLCLDIGEWGVAGTRARKRSRNNVILTALEKETLKLVTQREASLGIFHAVGKIVYNKRGDASIATEGPCLPSPPDHIRHHDRPKPSQVLVNELVEETGTDTQTFISALHENYVPSCAGPSFADRVDACISALSDSDVLCVNHKGRVSGTSAGVDQLRQEDISYQVAARGLLFALPHPVQRHITSSSPVGRSSDAHKMSFPRTLRVIREAEEIEGLTNIWGKRLLDPVSVTSSNSTKDLGMSMSVRKYKPDKVNDYYHDRAGIVTMISRADLLLYQLPYLAKIHRDEAEINQLQRITCFHETELPRDRLGDSIHDAEKNHLGFALVEYGVPRCLQLSNLICNNHDTSNGMGLPGYEQEQEKLMLSDDDIVDDL